MFRKTLNRVKRTDRERRVTKYKVKTPFSHRILRKLCGPFSQELFTNNLLTYFMEYIDPTGKLDEPGPTGNNCKQ